MAKKARWRGGGMQVASSAIAYSGFVPLSNPADEHAGDVYDKRDGDKVLREYG